MTIFFRAISSRLHVCSVVESEPINASEQKNIPNLTADERLALRSHKRNTDVVIREADKGSAVVVMSRERYIAEAIRQLSDTDVYQQVSSAVVFDVIEEVKDILSRLQKSGVITEDMATYAVPVLPHHAAMLYCHIV